MDYVCTFDPQKDLLEAVPSLATDLNKALESGVILDNGSVNDYNGLENVSDISGRVSDPFEAIDAQRRLKSIFNKDSSQSSQTSSVTSNPPEGVAE